MGGGAEQVVVGSKKGKSVGRRGFALANLLDLPLWKEVGSRLDCICLHLFQVLLDVGSIVGILLCIKGDLFESLFG